MVTQTSRLKDKLGKWIPKAKKSFASLNPEALYHADTQRVDNPIGSLQAAEASGIVAAILRALRLLIIPLQKLYQYWEYKRGVPNVKKPVFTRRDAAYLLVDALLFGLAIAAIVMAQTVAGAAIGFTGACITLTIGIYQYVNFWRAGRELQNAIHALESKEDCTEAEENKLDKLKFTLDQSLKNRYTQVKRTLGVTLTGLALLSAGLVMAGLLLGPVGLPVIAAGVAIAAVVTAVAITTFIVDKIKTHLDKKEEESPQALANSKLYKVFGKFRKKRAPAHEEIRMVELSRSKHDSEPPTIKPFFGKNRGDDSEGEGQRTTQGLHR